MNAASHHQPQPASLRRGRRWLAGLGAVLAVALHAQQPTGGSVVAGSATITGGTGSTVVTAGNNSVLRWDSFDIGRGESVQFVQPGADARVLNWIGGARPSQIDGSLLANGQVYLMNPSGVYFGQSAVVNVGALYAAGGTLSKDDFLAGLNRFTGLTGDVRNAGSIRGELVALVGRSVANTGTIVSPNGFVSLASGDQVLLGQNGGRIYVEAGRTAPAAPAAEGAAVTNTGTIDAGQGSVLLAAGDLFAVAITQSGKLSGRDVKLQGQGRGDVLVSGTIDASASGAGQTGGRVEITGERVGLVGNATVDASGSAGGGTILVGGDYQGKNAGVRNATHTYIGAGASLTADALATGRGGKVIVWADNITRFLGAVSARGGAQGGNGGFAEVSGKGYLDFQGKVDLRAPLGASGLLLLDPANITIQAAGPDIDGAISVATDDILAATDLDNAAGDFAGADSIITDAALEGLLATADVSLAATNDITVASAVGWNSAFGLTLDAGNAIAVNAAVTNAGSGGLTFNAGAGGVQIGAQVATAGNLAITSGGAVSSSAQVNIGGTTSINAGTNGISLAVPLTTFGGSVSVIGGSVTLRDNGGLILGSSTITGNLDVFVQSGGLTQVGAISVAGQTLVDAGSGVVTLSDSGNDFGSLVTIAGSAISVTDANDFTFSDLIATGNLTVVAGGNIAQTTAANVGGTSSFTGNNITLNDASNIFTGAVSLNGAAVSLRNTTGVVLGASTITGNLSVNAAGAITDTGALAVTGTTTLTAGAANDITLNNANNFGGAVSIISGNHVTLVDTGALALGTSAVSGNLSLTAGSHITQTGVITATGGTTTVAVTAAGSDILLGTQANNFGTSAPVLGGTVTNIRDLALRNINAGATLPDFTGLTLEDLTLVFNNAAITLPALTLTGGLTATSGGAFTLGGNLGAVGAVVLSSGTAAMDLDGTVNADSLTITNSGALNIDAVVTVTGAVTQTNAATGTTTLNAAVNAGSADLKGTTLDLGANNLNVGAGAGALTHSAAVTSSTGSIVAGTLTLNGAADVGSVGTPLSTSATALVLGKTAGATFVSTTGGTSLAGTTGTGDLSVGTAGAITQGGGALSVGGSTTLNAGANSITLANSSNNFTGAVSLQATGANDISVADSGALDLGTINAGQNLTISAGGTVSDSGALTVAGNLSVATTAGDVSLNTATNSFGGTLAFTLPGTANVTLVDMTAVDLPALTVNSLTVTSGGAITQSGALAVTGLGNFKTLNNGGAAITLDNAANTFGSVGAQARDLADAADAAGDITLVGTGGTVIAGLRTAGNAVVGGGTGAITQSGSFVVGGTTDISTGAAAITLDDAGNDFTGAVALTNTGNHNVALKDANALVLGNVSVGTGTLTITANAGGSPSASGISQTGTVQQSGGAGAATFIGGAGAITLANAANDFTGPVALSNSGTNNVSVRDGTGGLQLGTVNVGNNLTLQSTGGNISLHSAGSLVVPGILRLIAGSNDILLDEDNDLNRVVVESGNHVTIGAIDGLMFGDGSATATGVSTVAGNLTVNSAGGAVTQSEALLVGGTTTINAGANVITLTNTSNDFTGAVSLNNSGSNAVAITDANAILLGASSVGSGALTVNAVGITQNGALVQAASAGATTFNGGAGAITLTNSSNDFTGVVSLSNSGANDVAITDANGLVLDTLSLGRNLTVNAGALDLQQDVTAAGAIVTLNHSGNLTQASGKVITAATLNLEGLGNVGDDTPTRIATDVTTINFNKASGAGDAFLAETSGATLTGTTDGAINVTAGGTVALNGLAAAGGFSAPGVSLALQGTLAGAMDFDADVTLAGATTFSGNVTLGVGAGTLLFDAAGFALTFDNALTLTSDATFTGGAGALTFSSGVNGAFALVVNAGAGGVRFPVGVGGSTRLASLQIVGGTARVGGNFRTNGNTQNYANLVLTGDTTFDETFVTGDINFNGTIEGDGLGPWALTATTTANTLFADTVGLTNALASVTVNGGGTVQLNGGSITTTGLQSYSDAVTLGAATVLSTTNSAVTFGATLDSAAATTRDLTINAGSGAISLNGAVGGTDALGAVTLNSTGTTTLASTAQAGSLTTNAGGTTVLNGDVTTTGVQAYGDNVRLDADVVLATTNSAVTFGGTIDSEATEANDLTVNTGTAGVTFGGAVGGGVTAALGTLTVTNTSAGGVALPAVIAQNVSISTEGAITDGGTLTVAGTTTLATLATANITLDEAASNFGTVAVTSGNNVSLVDADALDLGASAISGDLTVTAGGAITDSGNLAVTGLGSFDAGANAITLGDATTANFGSLNLAGTTVAVTEDSAMAVVGLSATTATLTANGSINTSGAATLTTSGLLTLNAGANAITIAAGDTANFGSVNLTGTTVAVTEDSAMTLNGLSATTAALTANGVIDTTGAATLTTSGLLTLNAGANAITIAAGDTANFGSVNLTGTTVAVTEDSAMTLNGVSATTATLTANGAIDTTASATLTTSGLLTLNAGANAITVAAGDTANFGSVNLTGTTVAVTEDSAMTLNGLSATAATLTANGAIDTTGTATLTTSGLLTLNAGANAITVAAGDTANFGSVNLTGTTVAVTEDSAMTLNGLSATTATLTANGAIDTTTSATLTTSGLLTLNAGANAITVAAGDTANFGSVNLTGTTVAVTEDSAMTLNGLSATAATLTANGAIDTTGAATLTTSGLLTLNAGTNAITVAAGDTANFGSINVTGAAVAIDEDSATILTGTNTATSLAVTSAGSITDATGTTFAVSGLATFNAGANVVTLGDDVSDVTNFGSLNVTGTTVAVTEDSAMTLNGLSATTGTLTANGAIDTTGAATLTTSGLLTLNAGANAITVAAGDTANFGSVDLTGTTVAVTEDSAMTLSGLSATTATLTANGAIDTTGAATLTTSGLLTLNAGANAITVAAGDTANFGSLNVTGTTVAVTEDSAMTLNGLSATTATLTANGAIDTTASATLTTSGLLTLNAGANAITVTAGDTANFGSVNLTGTTVAVTEDSAMTLNGLSATTAALTANGAIDTTGAATLTTSGLLTLNAGANAITVAAGDTANFGSVNLTGTTVTVTEDSAMTLNGLSATTATITANGAIDTTGAATLTTSGLLTMDAGANAITVVAGDTANFGSLTVTGGAVTITEDSSTQFAGTSTATSLTLASNGAITQSAGSSVGVTGTSALSAAGSDVTLTQAGNDFGSVSLTSVNNVSLVDTNALNFGASTVGGNLTVTGVGITQTAAITVGGATTINAGAGVITLGQTGNDFTGVVSLNNSGANNVVVTDATAIVLGTSSLGSGTFDVTAVGITQTGAITQAASAGAATFNGGAGVITLTQANDFTGLVNANNSGGNAIQLTDANGLTLGTVTAAGAGNVTVTATTGSILDGNAGTNNITANLATLTATAGDIGALADPLDVTASSLTANAQNIYLAQAGNVALAGITAAGDFAFTASGNITTTGALNVAGNLSLAVTGENDITISNNITHNNAAAGALSLQAGRNVIFDSGADVTGTGGGAYAVTLNSDRNATAGGAIALGSGTVITSAGGDITLGGGATPGTVAAIGTATNVEGVLLTNAQLLSGAGNISIRGQGNNSAGDNRNGVGITAGSVVESSTGLVAITGLGGNGTSLNIGVDINGAGSRVTSTGAGGNISITGTGGNGTGDSNVGVAIRTGGAMVNSTGTGTITIDGTRGNGVTNNESVYIDGTVTSVTGNIQVTGNAGGTVTGAGNTGITLATGAISSTGTATVTLTGTGGNGTNGNHGIRMISSGDVTSTGGAISLTGTGGGVGATDNNAGVFMDGAGTTVAATNAATVSITGTANNTAGNNMTGVRIGNDATVSAVDGATTITGTAGASGLVNSFGAHLVFGGGVISTGAGSISITGTGAGGYNGIDIQLGTNTVGGASATGDILLRSLAGSAIHLGSSHVLDVAANVTTAGNVTFDVVGGSGVTQFSGSVTAAGLRVIADTAGTFTLNRPTNDVTTLAVNIPTGSSFSYRDANAFSIGSVLGTVGLNAGAAGSVNLTAGTSITQTQAITAGTTTLNAGSAITLTDAANNFSGTVTATGTNIQLTDVNALTAVLTDGGASTLIAGGALVSSGSTTGLLTTTTTGGAGSTTTFGATTTGSMNVTSTGAVSQTGTITTGAATFSAAGQAINLATNGAANNFTGAVSLIGANTAITDVNALDLGASTISGTLTGTTGGNLTDSGTLAVTGTTTLVAGANNITLDSAANDFSTVIITSGNNVTLVDTNALDLGVSTVAGNLTVTAGGAITDSGNVGVTGLASFSAGTNAITLGDATTANFGSLTFNSTGAVTISEGSAMDLVGINTGGTTSLTSAAGISDAGVTSINVGALTLNGTSIALGAGTFNATTINFNSAGAVTIAEDSAMDLVGINTGGTTSLTSTAGISDAGATSVDVGALTLSGTSIALGGGTFNAATTNFNSAGAVTIAEDSSMDLVGVNTAASATLSSTAALSDAGATSLTVAGLGNFAGTSISLGGGTFDTGTLTFNSAGAVTIVEDSATDLVGVNTGDTTALTSTAGISDASATSVNVGALTLSGTSIALGGGTFNAATINFNSAGAVTIAEDSAMDLVGVNTGAATALSSAAGVSDAGATSVEVGALTVSGTSIALGGGTFNATTTNFNSAGAVTIVEDSSMDLIGANTGGATALTSVAGISDAGAASVNVGALTLAGTSINLGGGTFNAATTNFNSAGAVTIAEDSATALTGTNTAASLTLTSAGSITDTAATSLTVAGLATLNAGANNITLGDDAADTTNFGTLNLTGAAVTITEDSATALTGTNTATSLTLTSAGDITDAAATSIAVSGLASLNAGANNITLGDNAADTTNFGSLTLNGGAVTITEDSATVLTGANTAASLTLTANGTITDAAATSLSVTGLATLNAGANAITLGDNGGDTTNFGSLNLTGTAVTLTEDSATELAGVTASSLTLTSASHITQTGVLNVTGQTTLAVTNPLSDILLGSQPNDLGTLAPILSGTVANIRDVDIRNINAGAQVPVISPATTNLTGLTGLRNLTLTYNNAPINLPGLTASGTLTITSGGMITDSAPSIVPGLSIFNSNGFDIVLNDAGNNFGTLQLAGAGITLFNVSSVNLAGVQASGAFGLQSLGTLTISAPINTVGLTSVSGDVVINAAVTSSGNLSLTAGQNVVASSAGTLTTTGGQVTVTAGGNAQLAAIATGGGNVSVTAGGSVNFISPLLISGAVLVNAGSDINFNQALSGGGTLTANTGAVTRFLGSITGLGSLVTNAAGSTVLAGGSLNVSGSFRFNDAVTLANSLAISGNTGRFNSTLNGGQALALSTTGDVVFVGAVGTSAPLASLTANTGRTLFYGGSVLTTGPQLYNNTVLLGTNTILGASAVTFSNTSTLNTGPALATLAPVIDGEINAATTGESDLTINAIGATAFNGLVGQTSRVGHVTVNGASTAIRTSNFSAVSLTVNTPLTFETAPAITVDTTEKQLYAGLVTLNSDLTFRSTLNAVFNPNTTAPEGIRFAQGLSAAGRAVTVTAPQAAISFGGDVGGSTGRLSRLSAGGRYLVVSGDIWAQGDIALAIGTGTSGENDFLRFDAPANAARNTRIDSATGEIILGSGATGGSAKTDAPVRASIFKTNDGDLYLFGRKVTIQPFERLVVRNGSLVAIADGTATADGLTLSSTAASNYLILVSYVGSDTPGNQIPGIHLRSRGPAGLDAANPNIQPLDNGTDLIAGAIYFFSADFGGNFPTREAFAPVPTSPPTFDYRINTGNILSSFGSRAVDILPDSAGVSHQVYVADLVASNRFRPLTGNLVYLDLSTAPGFRPSLNETRTIGGLGPFIDPAQQLLGLTDLTPMRALSSQLSIPRVILQSAFTPNVPLETREAAPVEVDLAPAVREQLQALGIYARALRPSERLSRDLRRGLFVTVPERERPREPDYEVADARVENRAVQEVLRLAAAAGLIGDEQQKLDEVARALADSYQAFEVLSPGAEARDFRAWLEKSDNQDAKRVLAYVQALHQALARIELLGLTRQELASSKAQIYGSILRARLNAEPEFLRTLVEGETPAATKVSALDSRTDRPEALAQIGIQ